MLRVNDVKNCPIDFKPSLNLRNFEGRKTFFKNDETKTNIGKQVILFSFLNEKEDLLKINCETTQEHCVKHTSLQLQY